MSIGCTKEEAVGNRLSGDSGQRFTGRNVPRVVRQRFGVNTPKWERARLVHLGQKHRPFTVFGSISPITKIINGKELFPSSERYFQKKKKNWKNNKK